MALILRLTAPWSQGGCCSAKHHLLTQEHLFDWQVLSLWPTVTSGITQKCFLPVRTFAYAVPYAWPVSPFFLCAGNHHPSQNPVQASASSRLPVSPTLSATIKAYLHPDATAHLSVIPQETVSSMRQELRLVCFWFLCAVHRAWLVYIYWLNEQAAEGNCSSAILNSENQIALCYRAQSQCEGCAFTKRVWSCRPCSSYLVESVREWPQGTNMSLKLYGKMMGLQRSW